jgi:hypothetical protein
MRQIWVGAHGRALLQIIHLLRNFLKSVSHTRYPGVLQGFFQMGGAIASGRTAIAEVAKYLQLRFI